MNAPETSRKCAGRERVAVVSERVCILTRKATVVIADDHADVRNSLVEILQDCYEVLAAVENGQQLVEAVCRLQPELAVIDVSMPVLNGFEALQRIKAARMGLKAVMISSISNAAYVRRAFELGARGYVLKAAGTEDLPRALGAALEERTFVSQGIRFIAAPEQEP